VTFDALPTSLKDRIDPWNTERALSTAQLSLMRAIKDALDPRGLLSPGRFIGGI
jgi:FAD/FMN-containing dehydrogenase